MESYLFTEYGKKKLHSISNTYRELSFVYQDSKPDYVAKTRQQRLQQMELQTTKKAFARNLQELSVAVEDVADTLVSVGRPTEYKKRLLMRELKKNGIFVSQIVYIEEKNQPRLIQLTAKRTKKRQYTTSELAGFLSVFYGKRLVPCQAQSGYLGDSPETFVFQEEPHFTIMTSVSKAVKETEKISGDNFSLEEIKDGSFAMILCDGMGSGVQANQQSQRVVEFLETFLEAGFETQKAFSMANAALASTLEESKLTGLDVCHLCLHTGEAEFIKAGASPSFCKRGQKIVEIGCEYLPLGCMVEVTPMVQTFDLMDGDMVIMMTDGVYDCFEDKDGNNRMKEILARYETNNTKDLADYLLRYAINCQGGHIRDDMTGLVAGVWNAY